MLLRYTSSAGAGTFVTAALIYWMQLMTAGDHVYVPPPKRIDLDVTLPATPPAPPPRRTQPEPPAPRTPPPDTDLPIPDPTTGRPGPGSPVTPPGPPGPPARPPGRSGPWATDTEFVVVAQAHATYPHTALVKGLEGYAIVEFTVTRYGTVDDISIVEATHPEFEAAATAAVARARYRPRIVDGVAVPVTGQRTRIEFRLDD